MKNKIPTEKQLIIYEKLQKDKGIIFIEWMKIPSNIQRYTNLDIEDLIHELFSLIIEKYADKKKLRYDYLIREMIRAKYKIILVSQEKKAKVESIQNDYIQRNGHPIFSEKFMRLFATPYIQVEINDKNQNC